MASAMGMCVNMVYGKLPGEVNCELSLTNESISTGLYRHREVRDGEQAMI